MTEKGNAHGGQDRGREEACKEEVRGEAHDVNDATLSPRATPAFSAMVRAVRPHDLETYIKNGLQLIPLHRYDAIDTKGKQRGKSPRDKAWCTKEYDSRTVLEQAVRSNTNVGVRLTAEIMVLDVDPRNFGKKDGKPVDRLAELVVACGLDLSTAPHVLTGSGGHHYYFRKPADISLLDSLEEYPGIEFKSHGRQVVAAGSVHPSGNHYEWDDFGVSSLDEMPMLPASLLRLAKRPVAAHGEAPSAGELKPEMLAETLEWLAPEDHADHDRWFTLMQSCHHATAGEGRQEFIDWSTGDPDYADDAWIIGRRWDSLHLSPTGGKRGRPVTVKYLHKVVQEAGGQVARTPPEEDFEPYEPPEDEGAGVDTRLLTQEPKATGVDAVIDEMNLRHYAVHDNGFQIVTEESDPTLDGRVRYQRMSKSDFRSMYENKRIERDGKTTTLADLWLKHPRRREYKGIIFDPTRNHEGWLNLWRGWAVEPTPGDWSLLRELIRDVLTDGDAACYEYVLNWMAFMFQRPGEVAEVAIAFRGTKGTGKGTLGRTLAKLAGTSGLHIKVDPSVKTLSRLV